MGSLSIHVVDADSRRRAEVSRAVFAIGHHAEIYSTPDELVDLLPENGVIIARDDSVAGEFGNLAAALHRHGRFLGIIATSENPTIDGAVTAIRNGAMDYLSLPVDSQRLSLAIDRVSTDALFSRARNVGRHKDRAVIDSLTPREREVLTLVAEGKTNREIGLSLGISPRTVEIHRTRSIAKMGVRSTAEAIGVLFSANSAVV
jgi:two-component system, LuxR family, response regulator FixJ